MSCHFVNRCDRTRPRRRVYFFLFCGFTACVAAAMSNHISNGEPPLQDFKTKAFIKFDKPLEMIFTERTNRPGRDVDFFFIAIG